MRSTKSRSRGKNNRNNNRSVVNVVNRVFDSSGPEGKVRGTPQQIIEKYNQLARDAQLSNDGVAAEAFQQHAEHYTRLLSAAQKEQDARREAQEAQNRERQAQRDADRAEQQAQRAQQNNQPAPAADAPQPDVAPDMADAPQPDVIEAPAGDAGLVETPEAAPKKERRPRKPRAPRKPKAEPKEPVAEAPAPDAAPESSAE